MTRLETIVAQLVENSNRVNGDMEERVRKLERVVWTASGGVIVAQGIFMAVMLASVKTLVAP